LETTQPNNSSGLYSGSFRDHLMGVTPARDPGPGKTDGGVGITETNKSKPKKGKVICLVPSGKEAAPHECVGSRTRDRAKAGPGLVKKIADITIFNQSKGNSGSYAHAAHAGMQNHPKSKSLLHLTS
jgi:co-chaperonin GroES (HSP10)